MHLPTSASPHLQSGQKLVVRVSSVYVWTTWTRVSMDISDIIVPSPAPVRVGRCATRLPEVVLLVAGTTAGAPDVNWNIGVITTTKAPVSMKGTCRLVKSVSAHVHGEDLEGIVKRNVTVIHGGGPVTVFGESVKDLKSRQLRSPKTS